MAYGLDRPPVHAKSDSFDFQEWFSNITKYVYSRIKIKNATASETADSLVFYIRVDATSGALTETIPLAVNYPGRQILICKVDSSGNAVTVQCSGSDTIQGSASVSLAAQWNKALLISNGNNGWERLI